ncbi:Uncharacterised protein [Candidatus Tiddalikarchaeum anstoanum]|nr:Uncharacterised protein [Candidatus Tiddalikarchaeum anstoanum]
MTTKAIKISELFILMFMKSEWLEVKHVKALSIAKIQGVIVFIISLVSTLIDTLIIIVTGRINTVDATTFLMMTLAKIVLYPIIGFLLGLLIGFSYNKTAPLIGGIKFRLKE